MVTKEEANEEDDVDDHNDDDAKLQRIEPLFEWAYRKLSCSVKQIW